MALKSGCHFFQSSASFHCLCIELRAQIPSRHLLVPSELFLCEVQCFVYGEMLLVWRWYYHTIIQHVLKPAGISRKVGFMQNHQALFDDTIWRYFRSIVQRMDSTGKIKTVIEKYWLTKIFCERCRRAEDFHLWSTRLPPHDAHSRPTTAHTGVPPAEEWGH